MDDLVLLNFYAIIIHSLSHFPQLWRKFPKTKRPKATSRRIPFDLFQTRLKNQFTTQLKSSRFLIWV
ncbi:hypothetical protein L6452_39503 [Arctium lappa]|uniref:Uncharacterized protein n=1 Tax=Arctium lappa TaxID=4217 RepID=A0ACB8XTD7_ARCLA|nr:hypothetical protein L6452_39503 [Arctium lappa]